jgi:hypothetical protein
MKTKLRAVGVIPLFCSFSILPSPFFCAFFVLLVSLSVCLVLELDDEEYGEDVLIG